MRSHAPHSGWRTKAEADQGAGWPAGEGDFRLTARCQVFAMVLTHPPTTPFAHSCRTLGGMRISIRHDNPPEYDTLRSHEAEAVRRSSGRRRQADTSEPLPAASAAMGLGRACPERAQRVEWVAPYDGFGVAQRSRCERRHPAAIHWLVDHVGALPAWGPGRIGEADARHA